MYNLMITITKFTHFVGFVSSFVQDSEVQVAVKPSSQVLNQQDLRCQLGTPLLALYLLYFGEVCPIKSFTSLAVA